VVKLDLCHIDIDDVNDDKVLMPLPCPMTIVMDAKERRRWPQQSRPHGKEKDGGGGGAMLALVDP
jgi:hypothetical protein